MNKLAKQQQKIYYNKNTMAKNQLEADINSDRIEENEWDSILNIEQDAVERVFGDIL